MIETDLAAPVSSKNIQSHNLVVEVDQAIFVYAPSPHFLPRDDILTPPPRVDWYTKAKCKALPDNRNELKSVGIMFA